MYICSSDNIYINKVNQYKKELRQIITATAVKSAMHRNKTTYGWEEHIGDSLTTK